VIDIKLLRERPDLFRASQVARCEDPTAVDRAVDADIARRAAATSFEQSRAEQNRLSREIGALHRAVKQATDEPGREDARRAAAAATEQAMQLAEQVKRAEDLLRASESSFEAAVLALSNLVDPMAPVGGEEDFRVVTTVGRPRDFAAEGFEPVDHLAIGEGLRAIDVPRGAKVSGSRFYYLTGPGAQLELALVNLAMSMAAADGLVPVIPPALVRPAAMEGTGFLGQAAENVYRLEADDLYLVGTAEVPLAAFHMDEVLDADSLPLRYAGYSPCFRREAGSHGQDTRGIFRVHWFDKVEMFSFCPPDRADEEHRLLLDRQQRFLNALELPYRVIDVATGDLGASAARKFDCEAWIPSQGKYRELTSTSNCTGFQARRLRIRTKVGKANEPVATLNGTLCAITRTIVALLENHQQSDGSVAIPAALQPFLGGVTQFTPTT